MTATVTKIEPKAEAVYVEVDPKQLSFAIKAVLPHAGTDPILPQFRAVLFELTLTGGVQLTATDRYTIGRSLVRPATGDPDPDEQAVLVGLDDVKSLASWLPSQKLPVIPVVFTHAGIRFGYDDQTMLFRHPGFEFPRVAHLFAGPFDGELNTSIFNGDQLARFATAKLARDKEEKSLGIKLQFGTEHRPVLVTFSDHFTGLIMPMRGGE